LGCGRFPLGAYALAYDAKMVFAIDHNALSLSVIPHFDVFHNYKDKVVIVKEDLFDFIGRVNVATAIEVFEHMPDPGKFISHLSKICEYAFITTPCVPETHKTRNPDHVAEYSGKDFDGIVGTGFEIIDKKYQTADLRIVDETEIRDCDSYCTSHVVQMVWARSRVYGK
jgi:cyclopropane fatty-acyl-phospholipid synthase-like methyltransferase